MGQYINVTVVALYDLCASIGRKPCVWNAKTKLFDYSGELRLRYDKDTKLLHLEEVNGPNSAVSIYASNSASFPECVRFFILMRER
jgi:hypothetical protein